MEILWKTLFWSSLLFLLYTWGGYLLCLIVVSRFCKKTITKRNIYPYVTVLVTVHNEEKNIKNRITNLLETDYPEDRFEIIVASDGSTDRTNETVESMSKKDRRIKLFTTERRGKSYAQNKVIPYAKGDIVILTDAETRFNKDTVKNMVKGFADNRVGCVSGRVILIKDSSSVAEGHGIYWKYETLLRSLESKVGVLHTTSGQIMAFRKNLFRPFENICGDDCAIPLDIIAQGFRIVHEDEAIAYDRFPSTVEGEIKTRERMVLRDFTCIIKRCSLLKLLKFPFIGVAVFSHKIFRWLTPFFMIILLLVNLFLLKEEILYKLVLYSQITFYFLGFIGFIAEKYNYRLPIASQIFSFIVANIGFFLGVTKAAMGQKVTLYKN